MTREELIEFRDDLRKRMDELEARVLREAAYRTPLPICDTDIKMLKKVLLGNGNTENSVATRLLMLERRSAKSEKMSWAILAGTLGILGRMVYTFVINGGGNS